MVFPNKRQRRAKVQKVQIVKSKRRRRKGPRVTQLLKDKNYARLRYVDTVAINSGVTIAEHRFSANGLFDPDETGTGHQPLLFDEYALLYNSYNVVSSRIKIMPVPITASTNTIPAFYGVFADGDTTLGYGLATSVFEDSRIKGKVAYTGSALSWATNMTPSQMTRSASFNAKKFLSLAAATTPTLVTGTPVAAALAHYHIWAGSIAGGDPGSVTFLVTIDYLVEFTDPIQPTPS